MEALLEIKYVEMPQDHLPQWREGLRLIAQLAIAQAGCDQPGTEDCPVSSSGAVGGGSFGG